MDNKALRRPYNTNIVKTTLSLGLFLTVEPISAIKYQARGLFSEIFTFGKYHGEGTCSKTKASGWYFTAGIPSYRHVEQVTDGSYWIGKLSSWSFWGRLPTAIVDKNCVRCMCVCTSYVRARRLRRSPRGLS
jgi:hypothetical protein